MESMKRKYGTTYKHNEYAENMKFGGKFEMF
jgi:hypothetical protein